MIYMVEFAKCVFHVIANTPEEATRQGCDNWKRLMGLDVVPEALSVKLDTESKLAKEVGQ